MNRRLLAILVIISVFAVMLVFVNEDGRQKTEDSSPPSSIVSLSPNLTEIIFALGLGEKVVAVSSDCDWPAEAKIKPKIGSFWQPNTEAIIAVKPDLVVCETFPQQQETAQTLKRTGLNVLSLRVESLDELLAAIQSIGRTAGCAEKAGQLTADINDQLNQIRAKTFSAPKLKILWVVQIEPVRVAGVNTFINEIIELAGGQNAIAPTGDQYPSISTEEIIGCAADVIVQSAMGKQDILKQQADAKQFWSRFSNLPAVKNKRIYVIDPDTVLRLGPRVVDGAYKMAVFLHPELFTWEQEAKTEK
ncbi:MAG: cobalamin-binding protein [Sedimentisphaerales bacterium]|nr:cobalamin-binding protein [Sedimentisphaerales bacterium]